MPFIALILVVNEALMLASIKHGDAREEETKTPPLAPILAEKVHPIFIKSAGYANPSSSPFVWYTCRLLVGSFRIV